MAAVKRLPADAAFSDCVREAYDHTCEMCGKQGRMECSHVFTRGNWSVRFDKLNVNCLCNGCHRKWHHSPLDSEQWFTSMFGAGRYELLQEKKNQIAKGIKKELPEIAKHYRGELKKIQSQRANGVTGYIDFESYQ